MSRSLKADRSRLQQLIENLIRNAIKHGGSDVTVTIGELDTGFYVADDGPGIPEASRDEVIEAGYSTTNDGAGLGLSIVKRVAEAHEWGVNITDSSEGGARIEFTNVSFNTI